MPDNDEAMTIGERRKYVKRMEGRYWLPTVQDEGGCWTRWRR